MTVRNNSISKVTRRRQITLLVEVGHPRKVRQRWDPVAKETTVKEVKEDTL